MSGCSTLAVATLLSLLLGACSSGSPPVWRPPDDVPAGGAAGMSPMATAGTPAPFAGTGGFDMSAGTGGQASDTNDGVIRTTQCRVTRDGIWIECHKSQVSYCYADECELDGGCMPGGSSTRDGCCSCEGGVRRCLNSPVCPSSQLIGKRCQGQRDCNFPGAISDLECRNLYVPALATEQAVCTRPCNPGCPDFMECLYIPNSAGEVTTEPVCVRTCSMQLDCAIEVGGQPLGSACVDYPIFMSPLVRSFCF